jgi:hypothetical protein
VYGVERDLESMVSFAFDESSACILVTMPLPGGLQATVQWSSKVARWLVLEAHKFSAIYIVCIAPQPDAPTRTAIRNLASTVAMLGRPAPDAKILLAHGVDDAALMIRSLLDGRGKDDPEWYRQRDRLPDYVSPELAAQHRFLQAFPRTTCLAAELISLTLTPMEYLQGALADASIGSIVLASTNPGERSFHPSKRALPGETIQSDQRWDESAQTPVQPIKRKRRLTLTKERGDTQTRLNWTYLSEDPNQ